MDELPDTNAAEARRWFGQASEDLVAARRIAEDPEPAARLACFLAHLAAEKARKALLIDSGVPFRKIHDLLDFRLLLPAERQAGVDPNDLADLNGGSSTVATPTTTSRQPRRRPGTWWSRRRLSSQRSSVFSVERGKLICAE